jgi:hypothetical protein
LRQANTSDVRLTVACYPGQAYRAGFALAHGFAERLIGSVRRERVGHIIVLGEMHLRRVLKSSADYYNYVRTHRSLNKDAPVTRQIQRIGSIKSSGFRFSVHTRRLNATASLRKPTPSQEG